MDTGVKKFRDKRLDITKSHTVDIFSGKTKLDLLHSKGLEVKHTEFGYGKLGKSRMGAESPLYTGFARVGEETIVGKKTTEFKERLKQYAHERHDEAALRDGSFASERGEMGLERKEPNIKDTMISKRGRR